MNEFDGVKKNVFIRGIDPTAVDSYIEEAETSGYKVKQIIPHNTGDGVMYDILFELVDDDEDEEEEDGDDDDYDDEDGDESGTSINEALFGTEDPSEKGRKIIDDLGRYALGD